MSKTKNSKNGKVAGAKFSEVPEAPTKEFLQICRDRVELALGSAIKNLFDDNSHGGEFYAHMLMQMDRIYDDPRIPTAAVSVTDKLNLYVNSYFFVYTLGEDLGLEINKPIDERKLPDQSRRALSARRAAVVKHEVLHVLMQHLMRGRDFGNPMLANIAADLVVNSNIEKEHLPMGLYPEDFKLPKDQTLDYYYKNYPIEQQPLCSDPNGHDKQHQQNQQQNQGSGQNQQQNQNGQGGKEQQGSSPGDGQSSQDQQGQGQQSQSGQGQQQSQGQGNQHGQGGGSNTHDHAIDENGNCKVCGGVRPFDNHDVWTDDGGDHISDAMRESLVKDAINRSANATKDAGNLPNAIQEAIAMAKKQAQIPWQNILRQFVAKLSNCELHNTKRKTSRRFGTRPGIKLKQKLKLAVAMDVSGSIGEEEYKTFLNEIFAIAKHTGEVEVIEWDTAVQGSYKIKGYKPNITRHGAGGTDPREAIKWVNDRKNKIDGVIFFTDGYLCVDDLKETIRVPSLWVVTADGSTEALKHQRKIKLPKKVS